MPSRSTLTTTCAKCGRRMTYVGGTPDETGKMRVPFPVLCPKCELIDALTVERYSHHERTNDETT